MGSNNALVRSVPAKDPPIRGYARVLANLAEGNGRRIRVAIRGWPGAIPGQFVMVGAGAEASVPRYDPLLSRPMAVYREHGPGEAGEAEIELFYRVVGRGTALLSEVGPAQRVSIVGPLGRGFPLVDCGSGGGPALLVGGGTGIASLYEFARALAEAGRSVVLLLGAGARDDLIGRADFEALGLELVCTTEDGSDGIRGLVTGPLETRLAEHGSAASVFAVGPTPMLRACADLAARYAAACLVSLENPMACGFGVCLGCAVPRAEEGFSLVCRDGPVFDAREIDWEGLP
ncbi:MAG: dihydroorotate dehydrogenase electron transfer subunit [bacterium]|nr:dihydroorotate dehydrogenase electron transfer subunit [Deltaproteobacteria bacterium]MCP4905443.1 dihydroorotate dehydrogenase electron transfer subunit [bacterium]